MRCVLSILLSALLAQLCLAQRTKSSAVHIDFPAESSTVYGHPHVLIIFDIDGSSDGITLALDGRAVPSSVFTYCKLCAGYHNVILTSDAPWAATAGRHAITIEEQHANGLITTHTRHYIVDASRSSLSGLSGHILLPDAFSAPVLLGGATSGGKAHTLAGLATSGLELADVSSQGFSWKVALPANSFGVAAGQVNNDTFGTISVRSSQMELTMGAGGGNLPKSWLGASFTPTDLARKSNAKGLANDILTIAELVSLEGEIDNRGALNYGATLLHPYGWSAGLYRVNMGNRGEWRLAATYRIQLK